MPTPDFVLALREKIGHAPLWLPGVTAVVFDAAGRVLLGRRADNGEWTLITGMLDPGEHAAVGAVREVLEETGVVVGVERLVSTGVVGPVTFPNGDVCTFFDVSFRCRHLTGEARVNDDESLEVAWFELDDLPRLNDRHRHILELARDRHGEAWFSADA
ncbi:NUDIX hydrolase [Psychromicrobium xiongbiense]|uniref:NUDIX hydrolase n=1 Tax=Psychromicrobium xiongbiense TaxID=3051184 RepID=UPI002552CF4A|nr:NUDIX domain-containing protein [Psychromicrobium sp. YIM S02556]